MRGKQPGSNREGRRGSCLLQLRARRGLDQDRFELASAKHWTWLRFDTIDFAAYDLFHLKRKAAKEDYSAEQIRAAQARSACTPEERAKELEQTIISGLPAAEVSHSRDSLGRSILEYQGMTAADLRANRGDYLIDGRLLAGVGVQ